jgi:carboxylesterase type B
LAPQTPAKNPFPVVVYFHGGGLRMGDKTMILFKDNSLDLTKWIVIAGLEKRVQTNGVYPMAEIIDLVTS